MAEDQEPERGDGKPDGGDVTTNETDLIQNERADKLEESLRILYAQLRAAAPGLLDNPTSSGARNASHSPHH